MLSEGGEGSGDERDGPTLLARAQNAAAEVEAEHEKRLQKEANDTGLLTAGARTTYDENDGNEENSHYYGTEEEGEYDDDDDDTILSEYRGEAKLQDAPSLRQVKECLSKKNGQVETGELKASKTLGLKIGDVVKETIRVRLETKKEGEKKIRVGGKMEIRVGGVVLNQNEIQKRGWMGSTLAKIERRFGLEKGDRVRAIICAVTSESDYLDKSGTVTGIERATGCVMVDFEGIEEVRCIKSSLLTKEKKESNHSQSKKGKVTNVYRDGFVEVQFDIGEPKKLHESSLTKVLDKKKPTQEKRREVSKTHPARKKSDGFYTISDRKECTFMPRKKTAAELKVAILAGLKVDGKDDFDPGIKGPGFMPGNEDPLEKERREAVEWEKRFCKRQDAQIRAKRKDDALRQAHHEFEAKLDKKVCPKCGGKQAYDQATGEVAKKCKGEFCGGALFVNAKTFDRGAFEARMKGYEVRHRKMQEELKREAMPPKPPKTDARRNIRSKASISGNRRRVTGETNFNQENFPPGLASTHDASASSAARDGCHNISSGINVPHSNHRARYLANDHRHQSHKSRSPSPPKPMHSAGAGKLSAPPIHGRAPRHHNHQQQAHRFRPSTSYSMSSDVEGAGGWELEELARHYVHGRAQQYAVSGGPSKYRQQQQQHEDSKQLPPAATRPPPSSKPKTGSSSSTDEKWNSLLF